MEYLTKKQIEGIRKTLKISVVYPIDELNSIEA